MWAQRALLAVSLLLLTLAGNFAATDSGVVTAARSRPTTRKLMQVEPLGCGFGKNVMYDCTSREWVCCHGNVFEYFGADPVTMTYFDYNEGAACMMCCAGDHVRCKDNTCRETCEDSAAMDPAAQDPTAAHDAMDAVTALDATGAQDAVVQAAQEDKSAA